LAVVRIDGRDWYLGKYGAPESRERYDRLIADWLRNGRSLTPSESRPDASSSRDLGLTVNELILAYWKFASGHYVRDGKPTDEQHGIRAALRPLRRLYGGTIARDFGARALQNVRQSMIEAGHSRKYINDNVNRIRRLFKCAVSEELLPVAVHQALQTVSGLRARQSSARESKRVLPVPPDVVEATLPYVLPQVAAMASIQHLSGARPGEVCIMRPCDITVAANGIWV
jgi:integrase